MDSSLYGYVGLGACLVVIVGAIVASLVFFGKAKLPQSPALGAMPLGELGKYYTLREAPLAWEKVRGWNVNETPSNLSAAAPVDHIILMPRLLEFCSGASGKMKLVFNFLVAAIEHVEFSPTAMPPGSVPPGFGLVTIHTPSGQTLLIASSAFAQALEQTVAGAAH
jgi:hypothetical protein